MTHPAVRAQMQAIYDRVPTVACKRKCQQACGPVFDGGGLTIGERDRVFNLVGVKSVTDTLTCGYLDDSGRCSVYSMRPLVCRLYGAVDHPRMRCEFGCEPERWLTEEESHALIEEMEQVAGGIAPGDPEIVLMVEALSGRMR